jgi:acyl-CoA thioester hydrolase
LPHIPISLAESDALKINELYQIENQTTVRVTYRDTDQMGHVYYANHLVWFEIGRTELVRQMGISYHDMEEALGVFLPVVSVQIAYRAPARYDDLIEIQTRVAKLSHVGIEFRYRIVRREARDEVLIAEGSSRHAFLGRDGKILKTGFEILKIER